jgi:NADH-quinone oxidoreductase subunit E
MTEAATTFGPPSAPTPFAFSEASWTRIRKLLTRYPQQQAALLPVLWVAQDQVDADSSRPRQLTADVIKSVADALGLAPAYVWGVATFYTMYFTQPVGKHLVEVCTSVACCLVGGEEIYQRLCQRVGVDPASGGTSADGRFTVRRAECLAACGYAPMLQLDNGAFLENLTEAKLDALIDSLREVTA